MARVVETEKVKSKKKKKVIITIVTIICVILVVVGGIFLISKLKPKKAVQEIKVLDKLDDFGYELKENDTALFKTEYEAMKKNLNSDNVDEEEYVKSVAKLFIIDLYTINNKINKYDIGGSEYFYNDKISVHEQKLMDTMYSTLIDNTYGDRKQELPEVKTIDVMSIEPTTYQLDKDDKNSVVDGYSVLLKWTYVKDMGYDTSSKVIVVKDGSVRWSVVETKPVK